LVELKDKNTALLNIKHDEEIVRKCCEKILKGV
jgi:predicted fused transcriptional regulator/phosphomethylpyrimidine kinase